MGPSTGGQEQGFPAMCVASDSPQPFPAHFLLLGTAVLPVFAPQLKAGTAGGCMGKSHILRGPEVGTPQTDSLSFPEWKLTVPTSVLGRWN